jgi:hypothetical protein
MENTPYSSSPFELPSHTGLWKTEHILGPQPYRSMENKSSSSSPAIQVYGKQNIFKLPRHTGLWKKEPIRTPQPYRSMENKSYSSSPAIQVYGKNTAYYSSSAIQVYGKQNIFELPSHTGLLKTKHMQAR